MPFGRPLAAENKIPIKRFFAAMERRSVMLFAERFKTEGRCHSAPNNLL